MQARTTVNIIPSQFVMRLSADDSLATGVTPDVQLSINGTTFTAALQTPSEVGNGLYSILIDQNDFGANSFGEVWAFITATGCKDQLIYLFDWTLPDYSTTDLDPQNAWDAVIADHNQAGSFGLYVGSTLNTKFSSIPVQVWESYEIEDIYPAAWYMRVFLAALANKVSGASSDHPLFRDLADTKNRIDATTSADGRSNVTLDGD